MEKLHFIFSKKYGKLNGDEELKNIFMHCNGVIRLIDIEYAHRRSLGSK